MREARASFKYFPPMVYLMQSCIVDNRYGYRGSSFRRSTVMPISLTCPKSCKNPRNIVFSKNITIARHQSDDPIFIDIDLPLNHWAESLSAKTPPSPECLREWKRDRPRSRRETRPNMRCGAMRMHFDRPLRELWGGAVARLEVNRTIDWTFPCIERSTSRIHGAQPLICEITWTIG